MKLSHTIKICAVTLITMNLVVSFCTIWLFIRILPAIDLIVQNNISSIEAAENMLTTLSVIENEGTTKRDLQAFKIALNDAKNNITNEDEKIALGIINRSYRKAFENDISSRKELRFAIDYLFQINRDELSRLKQEASQISMAGAWGLVFMSLFMFFITLWFLRKLDKKLLVPTNEIYDVIKCYKNNEKFRRCKGTNLNRDIKFIFNGVNDLLDERIKYDKQ